jgi:hypothetical protein
MRISIPVITLALVCAAGAATPLAASEEATCCFSNPRYSGQCEVTPGADESCADILTYLNSQNSVGKNYCGNTTIRGGWTTVTCEETKAGRLGSRDARKQDGCTVEIPGREESVGNARDKGMMSCVPAC